MATISKSFTAVGTGSSLFVRAGESFTYDVSGTFVGTVLIERTENGGLSYEPVGISATGSASGTVVNYSNVGANYRFRCSAFTSGTIVCALADVSEISRSFKDQSGTSALDIVEGGVSLPGTLVVAGAAALGAVLSVTGELKTGANLGTVNTGCTAVEYGNGRNHTTVLTVSTTLPAIAGGAALGVGKLLYTLPTGEHIIESAYMSLAITQTQAHINADTPKVGLGTVIATGAVSVLSGTATFMNIITEQTATNCTGTATAKTAIPTAAVPLVIAAAGAKTIHANAAASWAASGDAAALLTGTVVINWRTMA